MSNHTKSLFKFSYFSALWLIAISTYCLVFVRDIPKTFFYITLIISAIIWISVGHFSDFFFELKSLRKFRLLSNNIDGLIYVNCYLTSNKEEYIFCLVVNDELYNIYFTYRYEKEFIGNVELTYNISVSSELEKEVYLSSQHPFARCINIYETIIKQACIFKLNEIENPYDFIENASRMQQQIRLKNSVKRKKTISEILQSLKQDEI